MIDFIDVVKSNEQDKEVIIERIREVIDSGQYVLGERLRIFEDLFSRYCGTKYAVGVNSGTDALFLCLHSLGRNKGEVATVSFTFPATIMSIMSAGFTPVFVDVDATGTMDPEDLSRKINKNTVAIIPVHFMGHVCAMDKIMDIANKNSIPVIEDACQAVGGRFGSKFAGSFGLAGCFSFFPTKNLSCIGDGGAITTNDENLYNKLILLRNFGRADRESFNSFGVNTRLDEIQAVVLSEKIKRLDTWLSRRRFVADYYTKHLSPFFTVVHPPEGGDSAYHLFVIRVKNNEQVVEGLFREGVDCRIHYSKPCHKQNFVSSDVVLKCTDLLSKEVMSLPVGEHMDDKSLDTVIDKVLEVVHAS